MLVQSKRNKHAAQGMRNVLLKAAEAVRQAKDGGQHALEPHRVRAFLGRYWQAVREGFAFPSLPAGLRHLDQSQKTKKAALRPQSPHPAHDLQGRDLALPRRLRRPVHQQSVRTGPAHDQGQSENLGVLPHLRRHRRSAGNRNAPQALGKSQFGSRIGAGRAALWRGRFVRGNGPTTPPRTGRRSWTRCSPTGLSPRAGRARPEPKRAATN